MIDAINAIAAALPKLRVAFDNVIKGVQLLAIEAAVLWERLTKGRDAAQRMREAANEQAIALFAASQDTDNYAASMGRAAMAVDQLTNAQQRQVRVTIGNIEGQTVGERIGTMGYRPCRSSRWRPGLSVRCRLPGKGCRARCEPPETLRLRRQSGLMAHGATYSAMRLASLTA